MPNPFTKSCLHYCIFVLKQRFKIKTILIHIGISPSFQKRSPSTLSIVYNFLFIMNFLNKYLNYSRPKDNRYDIYGFKAIFKY